MSKARADFIIGELNRPKGPDRELVILMTSTHPMTDKNLCRTGHQIYNLDLPNFPIKWHHSEQVPENMKVITSLDELPCRPDIIISQNIVDQFNTWLSISHQFDCPVMCFEHTLPSYEWIAQGIPEKLRADLAPIFRAFITDYSRDAWQCTDHDKSFTIFHMVDTDTFSGWEGGNGKAMMMVNSFKGREWAVGDVERLLTMAVETEGPQIDLFGHNPGYISQPLVGAHQIVQTLREYDVFINLSIRSPIPASLLEAAAVGMPIVTTKTCEIPTFFKNGENCLMFDSDADCLSQVDKLLENRTLRKQLGAAARRTVEEHFNQARYVADWNNVLHAAIGAYHA